MRRTIVLVLSITMCGCGLRWGTGGGLGVGYPGNPEPRECPVFLFNASECTLDRYSYEGKTGRFEPPLKPGETAAITLAMDWGRPADDEPDYMSGLSVYELGTWRRGVAVTEDGERPLLGAPGEAVFLTVRELTE